QDHIQRALYPRFKGRSRMEAFPGLKHSGQVYRPEEEESRWDLTAVLSHLADYVVVRRVDTSGTVSVYNKSRYVGKGFCGREVYISLDPLAVEWVYTGPDGVCYRRPKAEELTAERVRGMDVTRHRQRERKARPNRLSGLAAEPIVA